MTKRIALKVKDRATFLFSGFFSWVASDFAPLRETDRSPCQTVLHAKRRALYGRSPEGDGSRIPPTKIAFWSLFGSINVFKDL